MKLIIEAGADVTKVDNKDQSPLCLALFRGAGVGDIKMLLSKGASFKDCKKHNSALLCVTDGYSGRLLKADVVEFLPSNGALMEEVTKDGRTPLQLAVYCRYETNAIRILLNFADKNIINIKHAILGNLLHFAVANTDCKRVIVKILVDKGVRLDEINVHGRTPLHEAMINDKSRELCIFEILVGCSVNIKCKEGQTPLSLAVEAQMPNYVLSVLLAAGAYIDGITDRFGVPLLEKLLSQKYHGLDCCKTLLKWALIEKHTFNIQSLKDGDYGSVELFTFAEECVLELQKMESVNVGHGLTLRELIKEYFPKDVVGDSEPDLKLDLDQLFRAISNIPFLKFSDVISSKVSKQLMTEKLQQLSVYTVKHCLDYDSVEAKIVCNYDCLFLITQFLSQQDLLNLIMAFYFTSDYSRNASSGSQLNSMPLMSKN